MIHIVHLITTLDAGGAEGQLLEVLSRFPRERYRITVAWLKGAGELAPRFFEAGIAARRVGARDLLGFLRRERPHLVHTHLMKADLLGGLGARLAGVPVLVSTKHNEDRHLRVPPVALAAGAVARLADRVVAISGAVERHLSRTLLLSPPRVRRILYGYPAPEPRPPEEVARARASVRRELGFPGDCPLVTTAGRLTRQKGLFDLLRAASLLAEARPEARYLVAGRGELHDALLAEAERLGILPLVRFAGFREDMDRLLAASDLFVLPSHWEGFGMVLLEAMSAGLPIAGSRVGAIPEVVVHGETGILFPPRDPDSLATAILRFLAYPEEAARMGGAGRRRVLEVFPIDRAVREHRELYETLLAGKRRR